MRKTITRTANVKVVMTARGCLASNVESCRIQLYMRTIRHVILHRDAAVSRRGSVRARARDNVSSRIATYAAAGLIGRN